VDRFAQTLEETYRGLRIVLRAAPLGEDLLVVLAGGEKPHIGSVVLAEPRPSRADPSRLSITSQVWNRAPHKEEAVARPIAEELARRLDRVVLVVSGIHYSNLSGSDLEDIKALCNRLMQRYLEAVSSH
jgi:hypothetical protein